MFYTTFNIIPRELVVPAYLKSKAPRACGSAVANLTEGKDYRSHNAHLVY